MKTRIPSQASGFTLIEIAIGLLIMSLVTVGLIASISKQTEHRKIVLTRSVLQQSNQALVAFVGINGRLPCPATPTSLGIEAINSNNAGIIACSSQFGYLPAVTLGMTNINDNGLLSGAWNDGGSGNASLLRAIRYSVSALSAPNLNALTSASLGAPGSSFRRIDIQNTINAGQGLFVCRASASIGTGANRCGTPANTLSTNAAAVIWSMGKNAIDTATFSADEQQNERQTVQRVYINRTMAPSGATGGQFDDLLIWISYPILANQLLQTGHVQ